MPLKRYELQYLPIFLDDLRQIVQYIVKNLKNPEAAEAIVDAVEDAIT